MHFRRSAAALLATAALVSAGCQTKVDDRGKQQTLAIAVFDPNPADPHIPLPNDLGIQSILADPSASAAVANDACAALPGITNQLACAFARAGGFPYDQEVPVTFGFQRTTFGDAGAGAPEPLVIDTTTVKVLGAAAGPSVAVIDVTSVPTIVAVDTSFDAASGVLTLRRHRVGADETTRRWTPGHQYVAFVRGGAGGVKTATGGIIDPAPTMFVLREAILSHRDLSLPENQTLIPGTFEEKLAAGKTLEQIRQNYAPLRAVYEGFGLGSFADLIDLATFKIAPEKPVVQVDPQKGSAPLPFDILRNADVFDAHLGTTVYGTIWEQAPFPASALPGLVKLDGFSTTASITAPFTGPALLGGLVPGGTMDASTISSNVYVFDLSTTPPTLVKEIQRDGVTGAGYVAQPTGSFVPHGATCPAAGGCASSMLLQPAVALSVDGPFLPPLKEGTKYAVVLTNGVKDIGGNALSRSTFARLLLETSAPIDASTAGDARTATLLTQMRADLAPVFHAPGAPAHKNIAAAYVFRTQSITETSLKLSALPYSVERGAGLALFAPTSVTTVTFASIPDAAAIYEVLVPSVDATSKVNGALDPAVLGSATRMVQSALATRLKALVAVPAASNTNVPACPGGSGAKCPPLVVFGHGINGSKTDAFVSAGQPAVQALVHQGFAVAVIDFPHHGDRAWCFQNADCDDGSGGTGHCTPFPEGVGPTFQGDTVPGSDPAIPLAPGTCDAPGFPKPSISGQTFIGANFFRIRDAFRQNLLDQSALVLAVARPPSAQWPVQPASTDPLKAKLLEQGIVIDPSRVYWEGISLGGIAGTEVLATNPRVSRGVTSVAGGALVDVFTTAPAFRARVVGLFTGLLKGALAAVPATSFDFAYVDPSNAGSFNATVAHAYGQTIHVAKWILDPGDPLNYAKHLRAAPFPNLLSPTPALQSPKDVLGQVAIGDLVIPNPLNRELFTLGGIDTVEYTSLAYPASAMHGIIGFDPTVQAQAASYLFDLTRPPAPPTQVTIP